jgi:hypothetical protein
MVRKKIDPSKVLRACWSKKEEDIMVHYPSSPDGHLLYNVLGGDRCRPDTSTYGWYGHIWESSLIEELKKRGYDITTLKFSIMKL